MFTGIIEATASVIEKTASGITLERPPLFEDIKVGSSISVAGVCLSIVELTPASMRFDVVEETWKKSRLGELRKGDRVNVERAMKAGDRLDGHVVQGHIEGVAVVVTVLPRLTVRVPDSLCSSIAQKGSIAIDGVSLTVASIEGEHVSVALIPHTLENTTLGQLKEGDRVNIETDVLLRRLPNL